MLAVHNNLRLPVLELLLLKRLLLSNHVVATHEHSFEKFIFRECSYTLDLLYEIRFALVLGSVHLILYFLACDFLLVQVRNCQLVNFGLWGLLRVQIVVLFLVEDIEPTFSLPAVLVVTLLLRVVLVFVHSGECEREVVFGVGVEVIVVLGYCLPQLLFLKLPDVQLLT